MDKSTIPINFAQGVDQKSDPRAIPIGKFRAIYDRIFTKYGLLQKRNGFGPLPSLPNSSTTYATTFGGNLTAIGDSIQALAAGSQKWIDKGTYQPISLNVKPVVRSALTPTNM